MSSGVQSHVFCPIPIDVCFKNTLCTNLCRANVFESAMACLNATERLGMPLIITQIKMILLRNMSCFPENTHISNIIQIKMAKREFRPRY